MRGAGAIAAALLAGCATIEEEPPLSFGSPQVYSASKSAEPLFAPQRPDLTGRKVVRPDLLLITVAFAAEREDSARALGDLRAVADSLAAKLAEASKGAAKVRMLGSRVSSRGAGAEKKSYVSVDGVIEVPLAATQDFWARNELLASVLATAHAVCAEAEKGASPLHSALVGAPQVRLADVEAHRAELTREWAKRVREFTEAAGTPLQLVDCELPGEIVQAQISLEETALSFAPHCKLSR